MRNSGVAERSTRGRVAGTVDARFVLAALGGTALSLVILGIPTAVIPNPWFTRMLATDTTNVVVLIASAPMMGALIATYIAPASATPDPHGARMAPTSAAGIGAYLAIGCPICNKIIVGVLGISGAVNVFAPLQPFIGAASVAVLAVTLVWRLRRRATGCPDCSRLSRGGLTASQRPANSD